MTAHRTRPRLTRRFVVLLGLGAGILMLTSATQTWVTAAGLGDTSALDQVDIPGTDVAETVTAMALVSLASAVAVTIAKKVARVVIGVIMLSAGVVAIISVGHVVAEPGQASLPALGEVTGTTEQAEHYSLGLAVWVAMVGALLLVLTAVALLMASRTWVDAGSKRYEKRAVSTADRENHDPDEFDLWDGLSAGDDPTAGVDPSAGVDPTSGDRRG